MTTTGLEVVNRLEATRVERLTAEGTLLLFAAPADDARPAEHVPALGQGWVGPAFQAERAPAQVGCGRRNVERGLGGWEGCEGKWERAGREVVRLLGVIFGRGGSGRGRAEDRGGRHLREDHCGQATQDRKE